MPAEYEIHLMTPLGATLDIIDEWLDLQYTRVVDSIGTLSLLLPGNYANTSFLRIDGRLAVYRNGVLDTETVWLIREVEATTDAEGRETILVVAYSANYILTSRVVAYDSETDQTKKSDAADSMMTAIVEENFGASASDGNRDLSSYLTIQTAASLGPTVDKEFAWDNVLDVLREIAQASVEAGSPVHFDVVAPEKNSLEFRTYREVRGINHTTASGVNPVILSLERNNLVGPVRQNFDFVNEHTFAYVSGTGTASAAASVLSASDGNRIGRSPFSRREVFVSSGNTSASEGLLDEAQTAVRNGRPKRTFEATIIDLPSTQYNTHWGFGDKVTAEYRNSTFDVSVDSISVSMRQGKETIMTKLRAED